MGTNFTHGDEGFYPYTLFDPRYEEVRYVGITRNPAQRYIAHITDKSQSEKALWIQDIQQEGFQPGMKMLEGKLLPVLSLERERYWIHHYLTLGARLTNDRIFTPVNLEVSSPPLFSEQNTTYPLETLICHLPINLTDLSRECGVSVDTIHMLRRGRAARLYIVRRLFDALSKIYDYPLSLDNVTGIEVYQNTSGKGRVKA